MKKKFLSLFLCLIFCTVLILPASATSSKPAVEIMDIDLDMNSVGGVSIDLDFRNNSGKQIKYIYWRATAYNRVNDPIIDDIRNKSSVFLRTMGPIDSFSFIFDSEDASEYSKYVNTPFSEQIGTFYKIKCNGDDSCYISVDKYGNPFAEAGYSLDKFVYLTDDEISNAIYTDSDHFPNAFYNRTIDHVIIDYALVEYMDGTMQRVDNVMSKYYNYELQNEPFMPTVARYSAVYNYNDYKALNPDLVTIMGGNEKLLFEHFINNGMKEGRQGSTEFNLAAYKANNPDLVHVLGDDNVKYYEHYISSGKAEGRKAV